MESVPWVQERSAGYPLAATRDNPWGDHVVTIADVAAHARVGAGTVSRVLNDSPQVSEETRERVRASIAALGYRPNPVARALSQGRCLTIGAVVPFLTQPSAVERLRGLAGALDTSQYDLVLFNVESPVHRDDHFHSVLRRGWVDGLLIFTLPVPDDELARLRHSLPVVLVDTQGDDTPCVVTDDVEGGRLATRHLVALGHQRIAFIGDTPDDGFGFVSSVKREQGYREVLAEAGLPVVEDLIRHGTHDHDVARHIAEDLLGRRPRPTAVFAASDVQALGVIAAATDAGLRVPRDLSVVGFDDVSISRYARLTTVRQPLFESGRLAARLMFDALASRRAIEAGVHELPLELVERSTTGPPPHRRTRPPTQGVFA
jgi:DNA-binding LacI/PurR family transcriptional regulator